MSTTTNPEDDTAADAATETDRATSETSDASDASALQGSVDASDTGESELSAEMLSAETANESEELAGAQAILEQAETELPLEQAEGAAPAMPSHFEPIPQAKLKRAKRIKRTLITVIVLLIIVLLGSAAAGVYYYLNVSQAPALITQPSLIGQQNQDEVQDRGTTATIAMPNLVQMFGKTPEQVQATLGSAYLITKTEVVMDDIVSSGAAATDTGATGTSDTGTSDTGATGASDTAGTNLATTQVVTISYSPEKDSGSVGTAQVQNIYLSLGAAGTVIEVYFVSSMSLLDYPISSFADLVATKTSFANALTSAGATLAPDTAFVAPTKEEYTQFVDAEASIKKVRKQTTTLKGSLASDQAPTFFELTFTYDFGASGVEDVSGIQPSQRMLYLKLSS